MKWAQKLDHKLRCILEQITKPVEGQNDGQETAALGGDTRAAIHLLDRLDRQEEEADAERRRYRKR